VAISLLSACANQEMALPTPKQVFATKPTYNFPINDPYAATVITVPPEMRVDYSSVPDPQVREITLFSDRTIPDGFWYESGLKYSELLQEKPAPLVYIVPGTGADSQASIMRTIADVLYSAGYSVVMLPSPTNPNFIINASKNFLPGDPVEDADDLYRAMRAIDEQVTSETPITGRMLVGYSLGGLEAAFTAKIDGDYQKLNFSKVLLINPPLSLYTSIALLDADLKSGMPNGMDDAGPFIKREITRFSKIGHGEEAFDFQNEHMLLEYYNKFHPSDAQLASLIGLSFRLSAADMVFTSDIMRHGGYIYPKDKPFTRTTNLDLYMAVALRTDFMDYLNDVFYESRRAKNPRLTKQDVIVDTNLESLAAYIIRNPKFAMITNHDDIILGPGDVDQLASLFGPDVMVFPNGGHMGNIALPAMAYQIVSFMKQ
jgi:pimeloyl-ACP methyl ester carboxylesterase